MEETGYESRRTSKTELFVVFFRMSRDFDGAHEILKWRPVCSDIFQIARFFFRFIEHRTIHSNFVKKCSPELYWVSTVQFMTVVHVEEPKESAFSRCPWQTKMHTEDGVTSGSERLRKPEKWTRILEDRSMMTRSTRATSISTPRILKYVSIAL